MSVTVKLPAIIDGSETEPLRRAFRDALTHGTDIAVDGRLPERVSTACLQVMLAAHRSAHAANLGFGIDQASPALRAAIADLGLDVEFKIGVDERG